MFATLTSSVRAKGRAAIAPLAAIGLFAIAIPAAGQPAIRGGGRAPETIDQLAPADRRELDRAIRDVQKRHQKRAAAVISNTAPYALFPMAGEPGRDVFISNFVDLDPGSPGVRDYECTAYTYDGHQGHDAVIRTFREQDIGVPIFAARDGRVAATRDGEPDRETVWVEGKRANYVLLDHGDGTTTSYLHMRRGSVRVQVGQQVTAGSELGLIGSSGFSSAPHLHFETRNAGGAVEPSSGPCQTATSWWSTQPPLTRELQIRDAHFSREQPPNEWAAYLESTAPRLGTALLGDSGIYLELTVHNLPGASSYEIELRRPDGSVAEALSGSFDNDVLFRRSWWWWQFAHHVEVAGTWSAVIQINDVTLGSFPLRVVAPGGDVSNRPPGRLRGVRLEPSSPTVERALRCVVDTPLVGSDPELAVMRYRYRWRVNGQLRREVVSAATSDMLARGVAVSGDAVSCEVTPSDGALFGPPATVQSLPQPLVCEPDATTLCLLDRRFQVRASWRNQHDGSSGRARVSPQSEVSGLLWFSSADNPELMIKLLDFGDVVKVFYGQLSDLEIELEVTETATGAIRVYRNAPDNCGEIDQLAFPKRGVTSGNCTPSPTAVCLGDRFRVEASWESQYDGSAGDASGVVLPGGLAAALAFADPGNVELLVKVLDFSDRVLVLWGALSDLGYTLRVTDTGTGVERVYTNPAGRYCGGLDPAAF